MLRTQWRPAQGDRAAGEDQSRNGNGLGRTLQQSGGRPEIANRAGCLPARRAQSGAHQRLR
eukprot:8213126-Alexandrium_andersonii.AAC.1